MDCVRIPDFKPEWGWANPTASEERARWCCEQLEEGRVLLFDRVPFDLPETAREFLRSSGRFNTVGRGPITFDPEVETLRSFSGGTSYQRDRMSEILRHCSQYSAEFLSQLLIPYAPHWSLGSASFRPHPEERGDLPTHRREDLLHIDVLSGRPTGGARILRCFSNLHPTQSQVWCTTEPFPQVASRFAPDCGLARLATNRSSPRSRLALAVKKALGLNAPSPTPYDRFMWQFHGYLKQNVTFQASSPKFGMVFPPGSTWVCFTDAFPHAMLQSQFALEQTLLVPIGAMLAPEKSPLRILESLAEHPMVPALRRDLDIASYRLPNEAPPLTARP